ncbi:MAG: 4Fe-4S binding protein [Proteobacteria bacterium]|nr:4Fe-4S binding protein [Pseudomonadota bacterium]
MKKLRYMTGVTTLKLDQDSCVGCGNCETVCPHAVFQIENKKAVITDPDGCMECGACQNNCPTLAITVEPGVGCAAYIISGWIYGRENASCGGPNGCC